MLKIYYSESKDCKYWSFCDRGYAPTTLITFYYTNHCYHLTRCGSISAGLKLGEHHWPEWPQTCIWPGLIAEERAPQPGMTNWFCVIAKITSNITKNKVDAYRLYINQTITPAKFTYGCSHMNKLGMTDTGQLV